MRREPRPVFDPSARFVVRRGFAFAGRRYHPGEEFQLARKDSCRRNIRLVGIMAEQRTLILPGDKGMARAAEKQEALAPPAPITDPTPSAPSAPPSISAEGAHLLDRGRGWFLIVGVDDKPLVQHAMRRETAEKHLTRLLGGEQA